MLRASRSPSRVLRALMTSSALGGSLVVGVAATPALADNECGAYTTGTPVVCSAAGGPYGRVRYDVNNDLNLTLEAGAELNGGLDLQTDGITLVVNGPDVDLTSSNASTLHIWQSPTADVRVTLGDVEHTSSTEAVFVSGVRSASLQLGDVTSDARAIIVYAQGSANVAFGSAVGQSSDENSTAVVTVSGNSVRITGDSVTSTGKTAVSANGSSINMTIGSISATGDDAAGVVLSGAGRVTLDLGAITTDGDGAQGVYTSSSNFTLIEGDIESVTTTGVGATGLYLYADEIALTGGSISTAGDDANGVYLSGENISFDFDSVTTTGDNADGVSGYAAENFNLTLDTVSTQGDSSNGVDILGDGDIEVHLGDVTTRGEDSVGVFLESQTEGGVLLVEADAVRTAGDSSSGVVIYANGSQATVNAGSIITGELRPDGTVTGAGAHGVEIVAALEATVNATSVQTVGDGADAIRMNTLPLADVTVAAGTLETSGADSRGVYIDMGEPGAATVSADEITTRGQGADGLRLENGGSATIDLGAVSTEGDSAFGVWAEVRDQASVTAGTVSTVGDDAGAVHIEGNSLLTLDLGALTTAGDRAVGVWARGVTVAGEIQEVTTTGADSHGVDIVASDGLDLDIGRVRTGGAGAIGVRLEGASVDVDVDITDVETQGAGAHGAVLTSTRDIDARIGRIVANGAGAHGLVATSDVDQTITVANGVTSEDGVAIDLTGSQVDFTLEEGGIVRGRDAGLRIDAVNGSHVILNGSVSATHGTALDIKGGATVIDNLANTIVGHIDLTANDDVLNNAGRFTTGGLSDFGDGDDVLNNTGLIALVEATEPRSATFVGLETLNNAGTIDLANGVAGDVFSIDGMLNGQTGNSIELDLDLRGAPTADRIVAGGFDGLSNIMLTVQGRANLGETGVIIAQSGMAQDGDEIEVTVADGGFVDFDLTYADGAYRLSGDLAPPAFEPTKVATGAQHQWTSGADVVSARFEQMRDAGARPEGRGDQVWAQVFGGSNDIEAKRSFDLMGESTDADLSHEVKSQGVQAGVDRAVPVEDGSLVFGMLAGAGKTELRFQNGDVTEYDGLGLGAYGHWFSGPLSIGVLAKLDTFKLDYDWAAANLKTRSNGFTVGARVDAAWRIAMGQGWYVEPQASLSWSDTALGRMKARDGAEVVFGDTRSVVGRIGVRAGAEMAVGDGLSFKPYAAVHALNEFEGDNASTLLLGDEAVAVADRAHGAWGRAVLGASLDAPSGLGGFIQAEGDFGEVEGFTARAGVKFSW